MSQLYWNFFLILFLISNSHFNFCTNSTSNSNYIQSPYSFIEPDYDSNLKYSKFVDYLLIQNNGRFENASQLNDRIFTLFKNYIREDVAKISLKVADYRLTSRVAIIIEPRNDPDLPLLIKHTMNFLNFKNLTWGLQIYCSDENYEFLNMELDLENNNLINIFRLPRNFIGKREYYNGFVTSSIFIDSIVSEHFLIFQNDVIMRKPDSLESYLKYDYVGAPWSWCKVPDSYCWLGGNGGVSIRRKSTMKRLLTELICTSNSCHYEDVYKYHNNSPDKNAYCNEEDTYLAYKMHKDGAKLANRTEIFKFSAETLYHPDPIFLHATWKYLDAAMILQLLYSVKEYYLDS